MMVLHWQGQASLEVRVRVVWAEQVGLVIA
jgi:hypothetical protein